MPGLPRPVVQGLPGPPVGEQDWRLARTALRLGPGGRLLTARDAHEAGALATQGVRSVGDLRIPTRRHLGAQLVADRAAQARTVLQRR
ncbi:hypothetical protein [Streptomyces venezuelae]|uniref:hypothetical protein n=1 Tax=Streptomyces venezuelae TaxID=54571 RepID=UPI0034459AE5